MASKFKDHFAKVASNYAAHRPTYPPELFEWLASITSGHDLVWDCATGSGQAAVALAKRFETVWATDASESQISQATPCTKVTYIAAPADKSGLHDNSADLVTVAQALHWFNVDSFYAEAKRVLKPEGIVAVWTYGIFRVEDTDTDTVQNLLDRFYYETVGPYWPPERSHVENGYSDLAFPFSEIAAPAFAMSVSWTLDDLAGYLRSWSATSKYIELNRNDPVNPLVDKLAQLWGEQRRTVLWPLSIKTGRI